VPLLVVAHCWDGDRDTAEYQGYHEQCEARGGLPVRGYRALQLLLWHGTNDRLVPPEQSEALTAVIRKHLYPACLPAGGAAMRELNLCAGACPGVD